MEEEKHNKRQAIAKSLLIAKLYGWTRWLIINGIGAYIIYLALFEAKGWAINTTIYGAHILLIILILASATVHEDKKKKSEFIKKKTVPLKFDVTYDLIISMLFASQGWFYIATVWFLQILFESYVYSPDDKTAV